MPTDDENLVERIKQGNAAALAEYLAEHRAALLAFIQSKMGVALRQKIEADDILQEVSAEAVRQLPATDFSRRDPFGWLCQLANHRTIDAHRRLFGAQKRNAGREVSLASAADSSSAAGLVEMLAMTLTTASKAFSKEQRELRLAAALAQLPAEQRQALHLRYVDGLPSKEIAQQLGKTDGAVRVMLTRSLARLKELLGPEETR